jgi:alkylation response protein AidB-like acyl-CoA dehydrogenase
VGAAFVTADGMRANSEHERFRNEVRAFFDTALTSELRTARRYMTSVYCDYDTGMKWQRILLDKGWLVPSWPVEYGGTGWSLTQRYIFNCERARANPPPVSPMGLAMLGPALIGCGTPQQRDYYLPRMLNGDDFWCQGYSEPQAGSDLAGLQTAAVADGDDYIVNGTKIWTTHAHYANRMFCLVRTGHFERPQMGVTFLLLDMNAPGVSTRPIRFFSGDYEQSQVFFDDVRVPRTQVVGAEHQGWSVTKYLLEFERGGGSSAPGLIHAIEHVREAVAAGSNSGVALPTETALAARLDALETEVQALEMTELRCLTEMEQRGSPGAASSMLKIKSTELSQRITEVAVEAAAYYGAPYQPRALETRGDSGFVGPEDALTVTPFYFNNRAASIYGGSNEIQRNIIAKAVLGL